MNVSPYRKNSAPPGVEALPQTSPPWWRRLLTTLDVFVDPVPPLVCFPEPPRADSWVCPRCPSCNASWFDVTFVSQCGHTDECVTRVTGKCSHACSIVSHKRPHAHYVCKICQRPFWTTYAADFRDDDR